MPGMDGPKPWPRVTALAAQLGKRAAESGGSDGECDDPPGRGLSCSQGFTAVVAKPIRMDILGRALLLCAPCSSDLTGARYENS